MVKENSRPKIIHNMKELQELDDDEDEQPSEEQQQIKKVGRTSFKIGRALGKSQSGDRGSINNDARLSGSAQDSMVEPPVDQPITFCDSTISKIIRECWSQEPQDRPNFFEICTLLSKKLQQLRN